MRFVLVTVRKELKRRFNDPGGLLPALLVPLAVGFMMASVMGGAGGFVRGTPGQPRSTSELLAAA